MGSVLGDTTSLSLAVAVASLAALEGAGVAAGIAEGPRLFCLEGAAGRTTTACDGSKTNCSHIKASMHV